MSVQMRFAPNPAGQRLFVIRNVKKFDADLPHSSGENPINLRGEE